MRLIEAVDEFLNMHGTLRRLSPKSIASYRAGLQRFVSWIDDETAAVDQALTARNATCYLNWLDDQPYLPNTVHNRLIALRLFWRWAYQAGHTLDDVPFRVERPTSEPKPYLAAEEATQLIRTARCGSSAWSNLHLRDEAAFSLLDEAKLTLIAVGQLEVGSFDQSSGTLSTGSWHTHLSVPTRDKVAAYLDTRPQASIGDPLFVSYKGGAWQRQSVREAIRRHRGHCGLLPITAGKFHPRYWSEADRRCFLNTPVAPYSGCETPSRDELIVLLGLRCGLRREEIVALDVGSVDVFRRLLHVQGKGKRTRDLDIDEQMHTQLLPYVQGRGRQEPLITSSDGQRLDERVINRVIAKVVRRAGLDPSTTPHVLRHTFATWLAEQNVSPYVLKDLLGHARLETVMVYVHPDAAQRRAAMASLPY